jgi:hypothetical protein
MLGLGLGAIGALGTVAQAGQITDLTTKTTTLETSSAYAIANITAICTAVSRN